MPLDFATLESLRTHHPAWRLLRSDHASLIASFLHRVFVAPNARVLAAADLEEVLEDELYGLRQGLGAEAFPRSAADYLNDWADAEHGWLRKFYPPGSDEPRFDLTPATEKALTWLGGLGDRSFVGAESRLLTLFSLLEQMTEGSEADPEIRIADLRRRRAEIDAEIARVEQGQAPLLDDTALKDRFLQFVQLARELLSDFREVEQNFRRLDRRVRERIALWNGAKGALLEEIMGERDAIAESDQGRSFRAFWDLLMSSRRQELLSERLERVLALPAVAALEPDPRTRRVHYDWLEAGEVTQRTVAQLSAQLRRFLDDQAWLENRRIMDILHGLEAGALALRDHPPPGAVMEIEEARADIDLPMERPLHRPAARAAVTETPPAAGDADIDAGALFDQVVVDRAPLALHVRRALEDRPQVALGELIAARPLTQGLAELVTYLQLASDSFGTVIDEARPDVIVWRADDGDGSPVMRRATLPRVIFVR
jgi:hypothetical protein